MSKHHGKTQMSETTAVMILLTVSGGFQDAYSYFVRGEVFANAQTGNIVLMAMNFFTGNFSAVIQYFIPVTSFVVGVLLTDQIRARATLRGVIHWRQIIVVIKIAILFFVGLIPVSETLNPIANALTSLSCAMQVQAFRKVNGHSYASTMCIGNMRSGMEAFSAFLRLKDRKLLRKAGQYFLVIFVFFIGAGIGSIMAFQSGNKAQYTIFVCCALLILCFILMMFHQEDTV